MSPMKSPEQKSVRDVGKTNEVVVEKDEVDGLPPGWTKEVKRRSGSKTRVDRRYTDPVTGYIFRSLKDAQRYLKTGEVGRLALKPKNNEDESLHMEERSECESKEQMSEALRSKRPGDTTRSEYCETDFRWTSDVYEMSPVESPEKSGAWGVWKTFKIVVEKDEADELPPGWTQEVKRRKPGSKTKFDRRYTDPVTGFIFHSLKDAQRYLKTGEVGRLASEPKNNEDETVHAEEREERSESKEQMSETSRRKRPLDKKGSEFSEMGESKLLHRAHDGGKKSKIVVEKDEAGELPPGWTKKVKTRTSGSTTKVDRYYTDPVTGFIFRSLKDVQRYLKTGELGRLAIKPKNNEDEKVHMEEREERSDSKEQMRETFNHERPADKTRSKFSETGEAELVQHASKRLAAPSPPPPPLEPKTCQATQLAGVMVETPPLTPIPIEYNIRQATHLAVTPPSPPKTRQAAQHSEIKIDSPPPSPPPQPEPKTHQAKHFGGMRENAPPASPSHPKTRRATRQAGIKIDSPPPSPPDTRNSRQATRARMVHLATPKKSDKKTRSEKITEKLNENADMDMVTEIEKQELPVANPAVSNPIPQHGCSYRNGMKSDTSINFSMNDLWTDPCIEFAVKTLTGVIPCGDLNKPEKPSPSPLKVPLEELWTDPCIEFAVKTLTGAIPVREDDHLQNRPATRRNTGASKDSNQDVGIGFCQTNVVSKHYETGQNKQQQGSTYVNGQCSKSRLF